MRNLVKLETAVLFGGDQSAPLDCGVPVAVRFHAGPSPDDAATAFINISVTRKMLDDADFDLAGFMKQKIGERLGVLITDAVFGQAGGTAPPPIVAAQDRIDCPIKLHWWGVDFSAVSFQLLRWLDDCADAGLPPESIAINSVVYRKRVFPDIELASWSPAPSNVIACADWAKSYRADIYVPDLQEAITGTRSMVKFCPKIRIVAGPTPQSNARMAKLRVDDRRWWPAKIWHRLRGKYPWRPSLEDLVFE